MTPNKNNTTEMENVTLTDNIARKKSLRKSVAFDGKNLRTIIICIIISICFDTHIIVFYRILCSMYRK